MNTSRVMQVQSPLRKRYRSDPSAAVVIDHATTRSTDHSDPFHAIVSPMPACGTSLPIGVHSALGGLHDAPTPGDVLCAAWASCLGSSLRMVANAMGVRLLSLEVDVKGEVDVRGTMMMDHAVPVGFQKLTCHVELRPEPGTPAAAINKLSKMAEHCCVVQQTLSNPPKLQTYYLIDGFDIVTPAA